MNGFYRASVPSNIAFLKYWGKRDPVLQWPANDSLSMTLSDLKTETRVQIGAASDHVFRFEGVAHGRSSRSFAKAFRHLDKLALLLGEERSLEIDTFNHFPMGAGMASSASGLAALTLAALAAWLEAPNFQSLEAKGFPKARLADLARQGSGSAGRSLFPGYVLWEAGDRADAQKISMLADAQHWALCDSVVVLSQEEKAVSSTDAHQDAWSSPLYKPRLAVLPERRAAMEAAVLARDLTRLGPLLETEALEMHAVIMTAQPSCHYLTAASLKFIEALRRARQSGELEAYFTIDAGPNIHVIHQQSDHDRCKRWLHSEVPDRLILHDKVGEGPQLDYVPS